MFTEIGFLCDVNLVVKKIILIDLHDKVTMSETFDKSQMSESFDVLAGWTSTTHESHGFW